MVKSVNRQVEVWMAQSEYLHRCKRFLMKCRRGVYGARRFIPGLSERHRMEKMVGPLGFWDPLQQYQLNVLKRHGMQSHHTLLDIGCGPLQGGVAFIRYLDQGNYTGVDINPEKLEGAYLQVQRNSLAHKNPLLIQSASFGKEELGTKTFDFIWVSQMVYYLDETKLAALLEYGRDCLHEKGLFLCDTIGPKHYECSTNEHGWHLYTLESFSQIASKCGFRVTDEGEIEKYGYPSRLSLKTNHLQALQKN
jgi:cyclopropane fatty-acyl-phospholipid synthase-like methyltransferase